MVAARSAASTGPAFVGLKHRVALTQAEAADRLGISVRTYAAWESGAAAIRPGRAVALACAALREGLPPWSRPADVAIKRPRRGRRRKPVTGVSGTCQ